MSAVSHPHTAGMLRAQRHYPAVPADTAGFEPDAWHAEVIASMREVVQLFAAAEDCPAAPSGRSTQGLLMARAENELHVLIADIESDIPSQRARGAWNDRLQAVWSMVAGAEKLTTTTRYRKLLKTLMAKLGSVETLLNAAALPLEDFDTYWDRQFSRGAQLLEATARDLVKTEESSYPEADDRQPGEEQNRAPVEKMLSLAAHNPDLAHGFVTALTALLGSQEGPSAPFTMAYLGSLQRGKCGVGTGKNTDVAVDQAKRPALARDLRTSDKTGEAPVFAKGFDPAASELLNALEMYDEAIRVLGTGSAFAPQLLELSTKHLEGARQLSDQNASPERIIAEVCALRDGFEVLVPVMDPSPCLPLVRECIGLINAFLDDGEGFEREDGDLASTPLVGTTDGNLSSPERLAVAHRTATFIDRLVEHFQKPGRVGTMGDLAAIRMGASVIISALTDPVEDEESLDNRLEAALESTSVILYAQPPKYWREPGILRAKDVGKQFVPSDSACWSAQGAEA